MKASDTVMEVEVIRELFKERPRIKTVADLNSMFRQLAEEQAEISFEAGETVGYFAGFIKGREWGIKQVVEWIINREKHYTNPHLKNDKEWQVKLKEWGL